jgi:hypothetical protein
MRAFLFGGTALIVVWAAANAAPATTALSPADIQATFFTGTPFTSQTGSVKYKMIYNPNGKMTREPMGTSGSKAEGTWKLNNDGFCSTWKGSKANCFRVLTAGENKWSVVKGTTTAATWSK